MSSDLRVDNIADVTGNKSPTIVGGELCRARFNLNGSGAIAVRDSFNASSFTDNGTGNYSVNFSVSFPNSVYSPTGSATYPSVNGGIFIAPSDVSSQLSASLGFATITLPGGALADMQWINCVIVGDKP